MVYAVRYGKGPIVTTKSGVDAFICQRSNALLLALDVPVGCIRQKILILFLTKTTDTYQAYSSYSLQSIPVKTVKII